MGAVAVLLMALSLGACGKIDIGGEVRGGKPMSSCVVRVMLKSRTFKREEKINLRVGFGFVGSGVAPGTYLLLVVDAKEFSIMDEGGTEARDLLEKEFREYSDSKFSCTEKAKRYIPNYYENFALTLNSDIKRSSGAIQISFTHYFSEDREGERDGVIRWLFYAANSDNIAFSAKSKEDAQKHLK
jgi:hypothetical protein